MMKPTRRLFGAATGIVLAGSFLAGCAASPQAGSDDSYTIAVVRWDAGDIFFNGVQAGEEQAVAALEAEYGIDIQLKFVAANDAAKQLDGLQALRAQGIDGVSLVPWRGESMVAVVEELRSAGIPVVVHNLSVPGSSAPFVAFDNELAGKLAAESIVEDLETSRGPDWAQEGGSIVLLRGDVTNSFDRDRFNGYMSVFQPIIDDNPGVKILERANLDYQGEKGRRAVEDAITSAGAASILAVGSVDGTMAVGGAIPALKGAGLSVDATQKGFVPVTSVDCSQPELESIAAGELSHCSEQPALAEGQLVQLLLYDMITRGSVEPDDSVADVDGWSDAPWGPVEVTTRDDISGPWFKTKAFSVPGDLPLDSPEHWANSGVTGG